MEQKAMSEKLAAIQTLSAIYGVAKRLYDKDSERFKPIYGWIGSMVKQRKDLKLVFQAMQRLAERELGYPDEPRATSYEPNPVADVVPYLGGTLRRLEEERDGAKARRGEPTSAGEILGELMLKAKAKKEGQ